MSDKRSAGKVGLFIFIGIVLVAVLMLNFSRGMGFLQSTYDLKMRVRSVAGLKEGAPVLLSGVKIGRVSEVQLDPTSREVLVLLEISEKFRLTTDAVFEIQQVGVLGDQYVIIKPGTAGAPMIEPGAEVAGSEPFNLNEVAQSASSLLKRFETLGATVEKAIGRVNDQVLDAHTLSNLSATVQNFQNVSASAVGLLDNASGLISNAAPVLTLSLTNLHDFSRKLDEVAMKVDDAIVTNRVELNEAMKNLRDATASLKQMTAELQSGKGLAGGLLKDEHLRGQVSLTVSNLVLLSSNLNRYGLLYKPKRPVTPVPTEYPGKSPFK